MMPRRAPPNIESERTGQRQQPHDENARRDGARDCSPREHSFRLGRPRARFNRTGPTQENGSRLVRREPKWSCVGPLVLGVGGRSPRAGILTSGSALLRLPLPKATTASVGLRRHVSGGGRRAPRLQWRDRAGFAPASLTKGFEPPWGSVFGCRHATAAEAPTQPAPQNSSSNALAAASAPCSARKSSVVM